MCVWHCLDVVSVVLEKIGAHGSGQNEKTGWPENGLHNNVLERSRAKRQFVFFLSLSLSLLFLVSLLASPAIASVKWTRRSWLTCLFELPREHIKCGGREAKKTSTAPTNRV